MEKERKNSEKLLSQEALDEIWRKYRSTFSYTQDEFSKDMLQCLKLHEHNLSAGTIFYSTKYLNDWGVSDDFSGMRKRAAKRYVDENENTHDVYDEARLQNYTAEMMKLIHAEVKTRRSQKQRSLMEIILQYNVGNRMATEELETLDTYDSDQFIETLSSDAFPASISKTKEVLSGLSFCRQNPQSEADSKLAESVIGKMRSALKRIAERSQMDEDRISKIIENDE